VAFGQTADVRGVRVTFKKLESDSRCPINAACIWEGDAAATFHFEQGATAFDVTLHTSPHAGVVSTIVNGVEFRLGAMSPLLVAGQPAPPADTYVATFLVR
jgi:hypothetical protein